MAKLLYSATMSLDGFIAGPGGDMSWLTRFIGGEDKAAAALPQRVGALLVGRRTWGGDDPNRGDAEKEGAFGGSWHGPQFVVTHHPLTMTRMDRLYGVTMSERGVSRLVSVALEEAVAMRAAD